MWTVAITIGLAILILDLAVRFYAVRCALPVFETPPIFAAPRFPPDSRAEPFAAATTDGLRLTGSLLRPAGERAAGVVVFCPEMGSDQWSAGWYCEGLRQAGFAVVSFDFRNQGGSDRQPGYEPLHWPTEFEVLDLQAILDWIGEREEFRDLPIGLFGISRGGTAALAAAARCPQVRAVVADGAYSVRGMLHYYMLRLGRLYMPEWLLRRFPDWHVAITVRAVESLSQRRKGCRYVDLDRAASRLHGTPALLISGARDTYVTPELASQLHARLRGAASELWLVPHARHNQARQVDSHAYDRRVVQFFTRSLLPAEIVPDRLVA